MTQQIPPFDWLTALPQPARIGMALWAVVMLLAAGIAVRIVLSPAAQPPNQWAFRGAQVALAVVYASVGALIVSKRSANRIGWLLLFTGVLSSIQALCDEYTLYSSLVSSDAAPLTNLTRWLGAWLWVVMAVPSWTVLPLLFPDGRLLSPRWRPALWLAGAGIALWSVVFALGPVTINRTDTSFSLSGYDVLFENLQYIGFGAILFSSIAGVLSLGLRLRRAQSIERQQVKWFTFAAALLALSLPASSVQGVESLVVFTTMGMPVATAIAILRYRLWDIDILIRRTLIYAALTAAMAAVYVLCVFTLQALFVRLTGQESTLAVVASTLAIVALFGPLRRRVQALIDRRFFRKKYDAQLVLEQFARRAQQESDLDALSADILGVVQETLEPESARLWLVRKP